MTTDWETEDFRKLYENPKPDFERLPFAVRCFAAEILRRCDRRGRIVPGSSLDDRLVQDLAFHVRAHAGEEQFIRQALAALLSDNPDPNRCYLVFRGGFLTIRNFKEAQLSESAMRMARKRARDGGTGHGEPGESDGRDESDGSASQVAPSGLVWSGLVSPDNLSGDPDPFQPDSSTQDVPGSARVGRNSKPGTGPFKDDREQAVFSHWSGTLWSKVHDAGSARATPKRVSPIRARLREGFTVEQLCRVIDAISQSAFHLGDNDRGKPYIEPGTIFRNREKVEEHLARPARTPARRGPVNRAQASQDALMERLKRIEAEEADHGAF